MSGQGQTVSSNANTRLTAAQKVDIYLWRSGLTLTCLSAVRCWGPKGDRQKSNSWIGTAQSRLIIALNTFKIWQNWLPFWPDHFGETVQVHSTPFTAVAKPVHFHLNKIFVMKKQTHIRSSTKNVVWITSSYSQQKSLNTQKQGLKFTISNNAAEFSTTHLSKNPFSIKQLKK